MAVKVPNVGELFFLNLLVAELNANPASLRLFQNNKTPADGDVAADYTVATFSGYANFTLNGTFTAGYTNSAGKAETVEDLRTFAHDGGGTNNSVYGWYILSSGGTLLMAERFADAPRTMQSGSADIIITPKITLRSTN
jgi:hypothetical protein